MKPPLRRCQFRLRHLLLGLTAVAILIQPAAWLAREIADRLRAEPAAPVVAVPDGGALIIGGGIMIRPDGTRQVRLNGGWRDATRPHRNDGWRRQNTACGKPDVLVIRRSTVVLEEDEKTLPFPLLRAMREDRARGGRQPSRKR